MRSSALLLLAATACTCPKPLCTQWLLVELSSPAWDLGAYTVRVDLGAEEVACVLDVVEPGLAPSELDIRCNQGTIPQLTFFDTSSSSPPDRLVLKRPVGKGPSVVEVATVHLAWSGQGLTHTILKDTLLLPWKERRAPSGTCASGCFTASVHLELPALDGA